MAPGEGKDGKVGKDGKDGALTAALETIPRWLAFQMRQHQQPGCSVAIVRNGRLVSEHAFGHADIVRAEVLTPRHRFRVASHSKTFTATAVMKLREQGRCGLDDPIGRYVSGLHPDVAAATLAQLLSHSAGLVRDGDDAGQWAERRPFLNETELRADLAGGPVIVAGTRFKYSNHGYGLLGLAIAAITGESYAAWTAREVVAASGLTETTPDAPLPPGTPLAHGHSGVWPVGRRVVIPAALGTHALGSATGFVSTAADLARFMASLAPDAARSVLQPASRREMARRQWRDPHGSVERWYGLGTLSSSLAGADATWDSFGHTGGFPGTVTRTVCVPAQGLAVSVLTNASDGLSHVWLDGVLHILRAHLQHGGPSPQTAPWRGRWWSLGGAADLLPVGDRVLVANPGLPNPLQDASEITVLGTAESAAESDADLGANAGRVPDTLLGRITQAGGYASHGEPAQLSLDASGRATALKLGGMLYKPEAEVAAELLLRYVTQPEMAAV